MTKATPSRAELLDAAADVARRFRSFDEYGSVARAARALRRRRPGLSDRAYVAAVEKALALYDVAARLVSERAPALMAAGVSLSPGELRPLARELRQRAPGFPAATYLWLVGWIYYWSHLR